MQREALASLHRLMKIGDFLLAAYKDFTKYLSVANILIYFN